MVIRPKWWSGVNALQDRHTSLPEARTTTRMADRARQTAAYHFRLKPLALARCDVPDIPFRDIRW